MLRFTAHLPDAAVGFPPVLDGLFDLFLEHRPELVGDVLPGLGVQVHRVEHGAPDVVLALVVGAVPNPHRPGVVVTGKMGQLFLDEFAFTTHRIHHLKRLSLAVVGTRHISDEREEVIGLAVQPQRVQTPQREGRVAHPRVAVVPVALAVRCLGQRRGTRRQQCSRRRVRQALEGQRAALQVGTPRMVGKLTYVDPLPPRLAGLPHLVGGFLVGLRRRMLRPGQRHEGVVTLFEPGTRARLPALESYPQVCGQPQRGVRIRVDAGTGDRLTVGGGGVLPFGSAATVVECGLAVHDQFDRAAHTSHGA